MQMTSRVPRPRVITDRSSGTLANEPHEATGRQASRRLSGKTLGRRYGLVDLFGTTR
jgi:hypothetical protein